MKREKILLLGMLLFTSLHFAQSDLDRVIKGGELLLGGLSILKVANSNPKVDNKVIESLCVKNKLADKITVRIMGMNSEGEEIKKELVIPKEGKECLLLLPKGIYQYEIVLNNNEIYKKGEYNFEDKTTMIVKHE
ncbi:MAG: hypothetical protein KBC56_06925 [Flavobacterium sp.]|nr:hypothetical protein [Flavobacterium sp.]